MSSSHAHQGLRPDPASFLGGAQTAGMADGHFGGRSGELALSCWLPASLAVLRSGFSQRKLWECTRQVLTLLVFVGPDRAVAIRSAPAGHRLCYFTE